MTQFDLIEKITQITGRSPLEVERCFKLVMEEMKKALRRDDRIELRGFGSFQNRVYGSYKGRNPKTGVYVTVAPKRVPFFKVGVELKNSVNLGQSKPKI